MHKTKKEIEEEKLIFISTIKSNHINEAIKFIEFRLAQSESYTVENLVRKDCANDMYKHFTDLGFFVYLYDMPYPSEYKKIHVCFYEKPNNKTIEPTNDDNKLSIFINKVKNLFRKS